MHDDLIMQQATVWFMRSNFVVPGMLLKLVLWLWLCDIIYDIIFKPSFSSF